MTVEGNGFRKANGKGGSDLPIMEYQTRRKTEQEVRDSEVLATGLSVADQCPREDVPLVLDMLGITDRLRDLRARRAQ